MSMADILFNYRETDNCCNCKNSSLYSIEWSDVKHEERYSCSKSVENKEQIVDSGHICDLYDKKMPRL